MWSQQRPHKQYRDDDITETQQNPERHIMHPEVGSLLPMHQQSQETVVIGGHHPQSMHPLQHQYSHQQQHRNNTMTLAASSNPRASRNMAEKQRRDNLNTNISTIATLVPTVAGSSRRLDKISILRLAAAYLRTQYTIGSGTPGFLPPRFNDFDLEQYIIDNLIGNDGFILVVTPTGKIVYISRQVEQQLGHAQNDLFGQSLYNFVYPEDHEELTKNLTLEKPTNQLMITETCSADENSNSSDESTRNNDRPFKEQRRNFNLRMSQRTVSRREHTQYECLHISGILRLAQSCRNDDRNGARARHRELNSTSNDVIFVGIARLMKKRITELSLLEPNKDEYVTRHLVDGRIIFCDHRISAIAGYMTHEVSGMSAFAYMHAEDVMWTIMGLRQMYDRGDCFATSCYRLKTITGEYIYLRTHAFVEIDKNKQSFESFVCVNTLIPVEEGEKLTNEMKTRYAATISDSATMFANDIVPTLNLDSDESTPKVCVEDPSQLENAISQLVKDLPSEVSDISNECLSPPPLPADTQIVKAALISQNLPPASIHANRVGIKKLNSISSIGKDKYQTMKHEANHGSPSSTHSQQYDNSSDFEDSQYDSQKHLSPSKQTEAVSSNVREGDNVMPELVSTSTAQQIALPSENPRTSEKPMFNNIRKTMSKVRCVSRGKDFSKIEMISRSSTVAKDTAIRESTDQCMMSLPLLTSCASSTTIVAHRGKPDSMSLYVKTEKTENGSDESAEQQHLAHVVKRSQPDDSISLSSKRRRRDQYDSHPEPDIANIKNIDPTGTYYGSREQMPFIRYPEVEGLNPATVHCKVEQLQNFSNSANDLRDTDSPSSSLHDLGIDYQQINPSNLELSGYENERIVDFPDLQSDALLSPGLDNNPDLMKMFDDLRPVIGFEKTLDDGRLQQLSNTDQTVNEGLRRTHMQLANNMTLQESQLCVLERDLENPMLQAQLYKPRKRLTELRAEQKKNTRILKTIQQDHHNMQVIVKQNIGV